LFALHNETIFANFFTDAVGIAVTVLLLERIVSAPERRARKRTQELALNEATVIYNQLRRLTEYPTNFAMKPPPEAGVSLLDPAVLTALAMLDLDSPAKGAPMTWRVFFINSADQLLDHVQRFVQRYMTIANPDLMAAIQSVERCGMLAVYKRLNGIRQLNLQMNSGPGGLPVPDASSLDIWSPLQKLHAVLQQQGARDLKPPTF
jgi:hypothetical protein